MSGPACCVRNVSAMKTPHSAATVQKPMQATYSAIRPGTPPVSSAPSSRPDEQHDGGGDERARDRAEDRPERSAAGAAPAPRAAGRTSPARCRARGWSRSPRPRSRRPAGTRAGRSRRGRSRSGSRSSPVSAPNCPDIPSMKMTGAIVAGSSAPRTRRTSLSERRQSVTATDGGHSVRSRSRSANMASAVEKIASPAAAARPASGSPSDGVVEQQRPDRLDHVGQRVVGGDVAQRRREQVAREERRRGEQQHEHEREDPTAAATSEPVRSAIALAIPPMPDGGDRGQADRAERPRATPPG